ncbi:MAG: SdiA-regulated domain-containing protein [Pseudomonadales bacterium]|nr:SdiA-regulated domain-containing protein [Pseudomonadales bacterium]
MNKTVLQLIRHRLFKRLTATLFTACVFGSAHHLLSKESTADNNLSNYKVSKFITVESIKGDLSGLALSPEENTLFAIESTHSHLVEINMDGELIRHIDLINFNDAEDIVHITGSNYLIIQERNRTVTWVHIDKSTKTLDADNFAHSSMKTHLGNNRGFEGIAWSPVFGAWVANEKNPADIYHLTPITEQIEPNTPLTEENIGSTLFEASGFEIKGVKDISALYADDAQRRLLVVSDESRKLLSISYQSGEVIESLSLEQGRTPFTHFLENPEGITMDRERRIYIAGEPNRIMVLEPGL